MDLVRWWLHSNDQSESGTLDKYTQNKGSLKNNTMSKQVQMSHRGVQRLALFGMLEVVLS